MIQALKGRVIIEPLENKTSSTIEIPDQYKESNSGRVLSVGTGLKFPLSVGDRVALHPNAAWTNFEHEGKTLRCVNEEFLIATLEDE